jgi:alpha-tubulin suppressor-like RCC1 family protein
MKLLFCSLFVLYLTIEVYGILSGCSGNGHICVVLEDRLIKCWGSNDRGQLGLGDYLDRGNHPSQVPAPFLVISELASDVVCGNGFSCFLSTGGNVYCWGDNSRGQLGIGSSDMTNPNVPAYRVELDTPSTSICAGDRFVCAVTEDVMKGVYCWGANDVGQLGLGDVRDRGRNSSDFPLQYSINEAQRVVCGANHVLVQKIDGSWVGWGDNRDGQLAIGKVYPPYDKIRDETNETFVIPVVGGVIYDSCGGLNHSCFIVENTTRCSGDNSYGQIGYPNMEKVGNTMKTIPLPIINTGIETEEIYCFKYHTCLVGIDTTSCFGRNDIGQLGRGDIISGIGRNNGTMPAMIKNVLVDGYIDGSSNQNNGYLIIMETRNSLAASGDNSRGQLLIGSDLKSSIDIVMCNVECGDYLIDSQAGEECDIGTRSNGQFCTPFCDSVLCYEDSCERCIIDIEDYDAYDVGCFYTSRFCTENISLIDAVCVNGIWNVYELSVDEFLLMNTSIKITTNYTQTKNGILKIYAEKNSSMDVGYDAGLDGVLIVDDVHQSINKSIIVLTAERIIGMYTNITLLSGKCVYREIGRMLNKNSLIIKSVDCPSIEDGIAWYWFMLMGLGGVVILLILLYATHRLWIYRIRQKMLYGINTTEYEPIDGKTFQ